MSQSVSKAVQLTLPLRLRDDATFLNFYQGNNADLVNLLERVLISNEESYYYLWGDGGTGRSHLLQACCHAMNQRGLKTAYIPLIDHSELTPEIFENLEQLNLI